MSHRDQIQQQHESEAEASERDHRRSPVKPTDKPVPSSPEPEHEAVRAGKEKLERVKPY